jgi:SAM-dependent methyltransferase
MRKGDLVLWACWSCGHVQRVPLPSAAEVLAMYADEAEYAEQLVRDEHMFLERDRAVVARLRKLGAEGPLVDVGAGAGILLRAGIEAGWEAVGLELSRPNAERIRGALGAPVHECDLSAAPFAPESVGAVTWSHTLEHVLDPVGALRRAREILRPGGVVFVAVPNWRSAERVALGHETPWVHPHHLSYFDKRSLARAFREAGLEPLKLETRPFLGRQYTFVIGLFRRLGIERLARRFLRTGERPLEQLLTDDVQLACPVWRFRFALFTAHAILALWPARAFAALGIGQELRGFARRPAGS